MSYQLTAVEEARGVLLGASQSFCLENEAVSPEMALDMVAEGLAGQEEKFIAVRGARNIMLVRAAQAPALEPPEIPAQLTGRQKVRYLLHRSRSITQEQKNWDKVIYWARAVQVFSAWADPVSEAELAALDGAAEASVTSAASAA